MKLLVFGSSHAKRLMWYDKAKFCRIKDTPVKFYYNHNSGKSFEYFLENPTEIDRALKICPDFIVVIFGGNSINFASDKQSLIRPCTQFYDLLRSKLNRINPNAIVIATPVTRRYIYDGSHDTPPPGRFLKLRDYINDRIRTLKNTDYVLRITGPKNLDNESCLTDGVHYDDSGHKFLRDKIINKIAYHLYPEDFKN